MRPVAKAVDVGWDPDRRRTSALWSLREDGERVTRRNADTRSHPEHPTTETEHSMIGEGQHEPSQSGWGGNGARLPLLFEVGPRIALTLAPMWCAHGSPGDRCPRRARYADGVRQRICQQHAEQRVRIGGLTALHQGDRARFLAESAGYAGGRPDDGS